jgi:hypothetical protein
LLNTRVDTLICSAERERKGVACALVGIYTEAFRVRGRVRNKID